MIKAINTTYKGYRFRSRLEARWAVVFDGAGIDWLYEPQGFVVNGKPYLPDFYLDGIGFFEVKGNGDVDPEMMQALSDELGCLVCVAFREIPEASTDEGYLRVFMPNYQILDDFDKAMIPSWGDRDMLLMCDECGDITVQNETYNGIKGNCCCDWSRLMSLSQPFIDGRKARFEHGEKGGIN